MNSNRIVDRRFSSISDKTDFIKIILISMALFMVVLATAGFLLVRYIREKDAARQRNLSMMYAGQNLTTNHYNDDRGSQSG